jgi:hypothetical protein
MSKTIFSKLLTTYVAILLISVLISLAMTYIFLANFLSAEKVKLLQQSGDRINNVLDFYIENGAGRVIGVMVDN